MIVQNLIRYEVTVMLLVYLSKRLAQHSGKYDENYQRPHIYHL